VGTHNIVASYGGDGANAASVSAAYAQVINPLPDTTPPANVTGVVVSDAATGGRLDLGWVNPVADFAGVLVLRRAGSAVSDVPATGQSYSAGQALGASTVAYVGSAASYADLNLANGTTYFYRIFAHDAVRNYAAGTAGSGTPSAPVVACAAEIVLDNLAPGVAGVSGTGEVSFTGSWALSGASGGYGGNSLYSANAPSTPNSYTWRTPVLNAGQACTYAVHVWWTVHSNRSTSVPITVSGHTGGASTQTYNEQVGGGQWVLHGTYSFAAGTRGTVQVSNANGQAAADAVRFVLVGTSAPTTTTLTGSGTPALAGTLVSFTATVNGVNPTGNVNFTAGGTSLAGCAAMALTGTGSRTATCSISSLAVGTHNIVASYGGDGANAASVSAAYAQVIDTALPQLAPGMPGVLEKVVANPVGLPRLDGFAFDRFGNLFAVLEVVSAAGGVVYIDKATGAAQPIALNIPGACRLTVHPNGDIYASSELPIALVNGVPVQSGGLYRVAVGYDAANKPVSGTATRLASVLDMPEGIQPLVADSAYGSAGAMFVAEDKTAGRIVRVLEDGSGLTVLVGAAANLNRPEGLEFGHFNGALAPALYAAETGGGRVVRIGADGTVTTFGNPAAIGGLHWPDNMTFGPDGYLYVGEQQGIGSRVIRIAADGTHSVYATGFDNIAGIAFDPLTGDLYVGEIDHSTLWRVRR
jgi:hypothetical protein